MIQNLYLLSGNETYEKELFITQLKKEFGELIKGINFVQIDQDTISTLANEIMTYPFGYEKKLILVRIPKKENRSEGEAKEEKRMDWLSPELESILEGPLDSVCLVFIEEGISKGKLRKLVEKNGECKVFERKKEYELVLWVMEVARKYKVEISKLDASYLVELCGTEKQRLLNEVRKVIEYVSEGNIVSRETIDRLCVKSSETIIFDLTEALGKKQTKRALNYLEDLLENKEPIQKIAIMIAKHFKSLLLTKLSLEAGKNVAKELNIKEYPARKYTEQVRNFSKEELIQRIKDLAQLDVSSKIGKMDLKIGMQRIICS